jgi:hypothetical protein
MDSGAQHQNKTYSDGGQGNIDKELSQFLALEVLCIASAAASRYMYGARKEATNNLALEQVADLVQYLVRHRDQPQRQVS